MGPDLSEQEGVPVSRVKDRSKVRVGKPKRLVRASSMRMGYSSSGLGSASTVDAAHGNYYHPELSTDFLELPQSQQEQWNFYRHFYRSHPFVGQALDLHTELPLSKVRISPPKARNRDLAMAASRFCTRWAQRIKLLSRLREIVHEYHLLGVVNIYAEDTSPDMPDEVRFRSDTYLEETPDGEPLLRTERRLREDANERAVAWLKKNYKGWTALRVLPPEQVDVESFPFTDEKLFSLRPDKRTLTLVDRARGGDRRARRVLESMPVEVVKALQDGEAIPLNTDPDAGSFIYHMERKRSQYENRPHSMLERCILPGTPITVLRNNTILEVPVELVNVETDLLLTHTGAFHKAEAGSRPVAEDITVLWLDGEDRPLCLTSDHPLLRLDDDSSEKWVYAGNLKEGDTLREAHPVPTSGHPEVIDLAAWWENKGSLQVERRVRDNQQGLVVDTTREVRVAEVMADEEGLTVHFEHDQDDVGRVRTVENDRRLTRWLKSLKESKTASSTAVAAVTGLTKSEVQNAVRRFERDVPAFHRTVEGRKVTWYPLPETATSPGSVVTRTETSSIHQIPLTPDFMYLLGTWFGDGWAWKAKGKFLNTVCLAWSIDKNADKLRSRIRDHLETFFGADSVVEGNLFSGSGSSTENLRVEDSLLARWFYEEFGGSAQTKTAPKWVFDLPEQHILSFLRGLLDTDGFCRAGRVSTALVQLDNETLIRQVHLLCSRVGIKTQVRPVRREARSWTRTWVTTEGVQEKTYDYEPKTFWQVSCTRHEDVLKWVSGTIKGAEVNWPERNHSWGSPFQDGWLTRKVRKVETVWYEGLVHSFDVEVDSSLVALSVCIHNCIRTLVHQDKLRQANASIASRHMTPVRIVWAEDMDAADTEALRDQVDMALADPDFSIVANFEIRWEEMGGGQGNRLLETSQEYDRADRELYAGLSVTESLLTGESTYSADRTSLEVINTRYMFLREFLQDFVQDCLFEPMCRRMGFIEEDEDGEEVVLTPLLSFTRLGIRDTQDTFDAFMNLYQKGSLPVETIYELLNIDPVTATEKLKEDSMTLRDATFNEVFRGLYSEVARQLVEGSDAVDKIAKILGLEYEKPKEDSGGRF